MATLPTPTPAKPRHVNHVNEPNLQVRVRNIPEGIPTPNDLEIVEGAVPRPGSGELLAKTTYLVVDPYVRPIVSKRAQIKGLVVYDFEDRGAEFLREATPWFTAGKLAYKEELHDGIETAPAVFSRLMSGQNFGKTIIRVSDDPTVKG